MARDASTPVPKYRRQKTREGRVRAFVEFSGRRHYLGEYNTAASKAKYRQLIHEWSAAGGHSPVPQNQLTIVELIARFWTHAQVYYRKPDGTPTSTIHNYRAALRPLKQLYGTTRAAEFGPRSLKALREDMISRGWCRKTINQGVNLVRGVFRWAVAEELVPVETHTGLTAVASLRRGRCAAREGEPVRPVSEAHVNAIHPHTSRQVWALVQLQLHAAARAGELVGIRPIDLDTSGPIWLYQPSDHKTAHRDHERTIYLGPRAQQILNPFFTGRPVNAYMFSPAEADAERRAKRHEQRKTPMTCGNKPGSHRRRQPKRRPGHRYTVGSYRRAIERACLLANVPLWTPHRLRHSAGTHVRKEFGVEAAQLMLGHARADVTQVYAERNHARALEVAAKIG